MIDPNIVLGYKAPEIQNPLASAQQALTLKQLSGQVQAQDQSLADDQAVRQAMNSNTSVGPDGKPLVNTAGTLSGLAGKVGIKSYSDVSTALASMDAAQRKQLAQKTLDLISQATPENYPQIREHLVSTALDKQVADSHLPPTYDKAALDGVAKHAALSVLDPKEQLDYGMKEQNLGLKKEAIGAKKEANGIKSQEVDMVKTDKMAKDLDKHLSMGWAARSGQAGAVQSKVNSAEAAEALIQQGLSQPGGLDSRQIEELSQSVGKLLSSGGAQASARVDALVPHTFWGKAQSLKEYLTNTPTGLQQQDFTNRLAETVAREKELAQKQMRQYQIEGLPAHGALKKKNPELYNQILQAKGIDPSMVDDKGRYKEPAKAVNMVGPDGKVRAIPADQVEAAKAAGGKLYGG